MCAVLITVLDVGRATTRERALEALVGLLSMQYNYDCAVERWAACLLGMRKVQHRP